MEKLYRFSPIISEEKLLEAIQYVAQKATSLCKKITGEEFPISSITIFSHYNSEFENLQKILLTLGKVAANNNGPYVRLHSSLQLPNNKLELLRVRQPDPYRMQVGCCDFTVEDYEKFKSLTLPDHPEKLRLIERPDYEMIEFFDPGFDVLAYITSKSLF